MSNYVPQWPPVDAKNLSAFIQRELAKIATATADDADRLDYLPLVLTPAQLSGNTNNYAPEGLDRVNVLRLSASGAVDLTGIKNPRAGKSKTFLIVNIGSNAITLKTEDANSDAANRFVFPSALALGQNATASIWYDVISQRWRIWATRT